MDHHEKPPLPTHVTPVSYVIRLEPDFENQTFLGHVEIKCVVNDACSFVRLHYKFINIIEGWVEYQQNGWSVEDLIIHYEAQEVLDILLPMEVTPGEMKITLDYTGVFAEDLTGFYQSSYRTKDGDEHLLAVTALEPCFARKVFPCFDEPGLKAEFSVSIVVDQSFTAVSNMPVLESENISPSKKLVVFQKSVPMSTYHLGLVAGPLAKVSSRTSSVPISVYCALGSEAQTTFALELASTGLRLFAGWFETPYPLPKLDLIEVPDLPTGAMENWGAIIFKSTSLLLNPAGSSLDNRQRIAHSILHKVCHMWFGDLVTMRSWDGLWLKESFATIMAWYAANRIFPEWHVWGTYVANQLQRTLDLDSLQSSHPIEFPTRDLARPKQRYDELSYLKGPAVLRMVLYDLGEGQFFQGLKLYLNRHYCQCAEPEDLWKAWEEVTGKQIATNMRPWTRQAGFPVLLVTERLNKRGEFQGYHLQQRRFHASRVKEPVDKATDPIYPLNVTLRLDSGIASVGMDTRDLILLDFGKLFKVNVDHCGFFRTAYSVPLFKRLLKEASKGHLSLFDCIGLCCDLRALVAAGARRTSALLDLTLEYQTMDSFYLWEMMSRNLSSIRAVWKFHGSELNEALRKLTLDILGRKAHELWWDVPEDMDSALVSFKAYMFSGAGLAGDEEIIEVARELFAKRIAGDERAIPESLQWEVFGIVVTHGGPEEFEALLAIWETTSNDDERYYALESLGRAPNTELAKRVLDLLSTDRVADQDVPYPAWLMGATAHGVIELWTWIKRHWMMLEVALGPNVLSLILEHALDGLHTREQIRDVKKFFAARDSRAHQTLLDRKLEEMECRRQWAERDLGDVKSWLRAHGYLQKVT